MKRKHDTPKANAHWVITEEITVNNRPVIPGTEVKIKNERGRFRFIRQVDSGTAVWVDVHGGPKGAEMLRSFYPERITRVHRDRVGPKALRDRYKDKKNAQRLDS